MTDTYIVAFTGGYEAPSFKSFDDEAKALAQAEKWAEDFKDGDVIDVLHLESPGFIRIIRSITEGMET